MMRLATLAMRWEIRGPPQLSACRQRSKQPPFSRTVFGINCGPLPKLLRRIVG